MGLNDDFDSVILATGYRAAIDWMGTSALETIAASPSDGTACGAWSSQISTL